MFCRPAFLTAPSWVRRREAPQPKLVCLDRQHLPDEAYITVDDDKTPMCRLITGLCHSYGMYGIGADVQAVTRSIGLLVDAGFRTFDVGSTSNKTSLLAGEYIRLVPPSMGRSLHLCTRADVNPHTIGRVCRETVERVVDDALKSLGVDTINLLQVSWSDFRDKRYIDFLGELQEQKRFGKIRSIGTVNFPTDELRHLESQRVLLASNQIPLSLVDRRARVEMTDWCHTRQIAMLAHSPLGAGLISECYLGLPEPKTNTGDNRSLVHFVGMIRLWGGWSLFQELLYAVKNVADKHGVTMGDVAVKWALQQSALSAVVIRAKLNASQTENYLSYMRAFDFSLDEEDNNLLDAIAKKGNDLHQILGDCGREFQRQNR